MQLISQSINRDFAFPVGEQQVTDVILAWDGKSSARHLCYRPKSGLANKACTGFSKSTDKCANVTAEMHLQHVVCIPTADE